MVIKINSLQSTWKTKQRNHNVTKLKIGAKIANIWDKREQHPGIAKTKQKELWSNSIL